MSAAEEKGATLWQAEQMDKMALHLVDDLMKFVMQ
jgi:hypothetical protein